MLATVKTLARILSAPRSDLSLLSEAFLLLWAARVALKMIPMERIAEWLQRPVSKGRTLRVDEVIPKIQWAIHAIVRRMPDAFVCFPQSLAAFAMLRRRGIAAVLNYGVNRGPADELRAHTWLTVGERIVVGAEAAPEFTVVRTFP